MANYEAAVVIPAYNEADRIKRTLFPLQIGLRATENKQAIVIVDNGSTDDTIEAARAMEVIRDVNFDLHIINEPQKGTGAAADTGFTYAIEHLAAKIIARIDADTVPEPHWFPALYSHHKKHPEAQLLTGPAYRGYDETLGPPANNFEKVVVEDALVPLARRATRLSRALRYKAPGLILHFAPGYNMSTTREAYERTGGFPRTSIDELDEDVVYNLLISRLYGRRAMQFERFMQVNTSSRRLRSAGYIRSALHYASIKYRDAENLDPR
jgi:glycosyltransferase involved in cell wall biosynthesis